MVVLFFLYFINKISFGWFSLDWPSFYFHNSLEPCLFSIDRNKWLLICLCIPKLFRTATRSIILHWVPKFMMGKRIAQLFIKNFSIRLSEYIFNYLFILWGFIEVLNRSKWESFLVSKDHLDYINIFYS